MGARPFEPLDENCQVHGRWQANLIDAAGVERFLTGCPRCAAQRRMDSVLSRAAIPPRFADRTLDNYRTGEHAGQAEALATCRAYVSNFDEARRRGTSLLLIGHHGTGKTHLAVGVARALIDSGRSAAFARAYEIIQRIRATWSGEGREEQVVEAFCSVDLLIIDEVGVQYGKESEQVELFKVVNGRYDRMAPMIVISNCGLDELEGYLGTRAFDRLREGGGRAVPFDWPSRRSEEEVAS